ncbi:AraC family transcriptional regulator [Microbacterium sp.]|uniref:AraC family transcriptional regulator n=1 Tax=Microbacterium sp. TaxID=51671 RepID=UPI003A8619EA
MTHTLMLATRAVDEARAFGGMVYHEHGLRTYDSDDDFGMRLRASRIGPVVIGTLEYRSHVRIEAPRYVDSYQVNLPLTGAVSMTYGARTAAATPRTAIVHGISAATAIEGWSVPTRLLGVKLLRSGLERQFAELTGTPAGRPIEFDGRLDVTSPSGRLWAALARRLEWWARADTAEDELVGPTLVRALVDTLLRAAPGTHTADVERASRTDDPASLALAIMHARAASTVGIADIAAEAGVGVRTLEKHVQARWGRTPSELLRTLRLTYARRELSHTPPGEAKIAATAARWGIPHAGRFAAHYADLFGESPSATVAAHRSEP